MAEYEKHSKTQSSGELIIGMGVCVDVGAMHMQYITPSITLHFLISSLSFLSFNSNP